MSRVDIVIHTPFGESLVDASQWLSELDAAKHLIRRYIIAPDTSDIDVPVQRAQEVIKAIREEVELIEKQMLIDFGVGPVACIVATPSNPDAKGGRACLSFGVHTPDSETEIALGTTVTPLYK